MKIFLLVIAFSSLSAFSGSLTEQWKEMSQKMNGYKSIAKEHEKKIYDFGFLGVEEAKQIEAEYIAIYCGQATTIKPEVRKVEKDIFISSSLSSLLDEVNEALHSPGDSLEFRIELAKVLARLTIFLTQTAEESNITVVSSGGNCHGHWSNRHLVVRHPQINLSISLGGGE